METGRILILAGPSGSGKTTVTHLLMGLHKELVFSVSATTRSIRPNEVDGKDYYFINQEVFKNKIAADEFVEFEEVYAGMFYGTLKVEIERIWANNQIPILDIDVLGALNIKKKFPETAVTIFIHPVSIENLHSRLTKRATETPESFAFRIKRAEEELTLAPQFDHIVYNRILETAVEDADSIIKKYL
ncbi:MAG: guanylate kinase [Bacteroidetes bacterium]|nr:guanylate kinase [Bacteroidota bacterium]